MKRTSVLCAQHVGRMIKFHWHVQGKIKVIPTSAEKLLKSHGYEVVDVLEYLKPHKDDERIEINGIFDREPPMDENHPDYKDVPCFMYRDDNVLVEGLNQAKVLTNTVDRDTLPNSLIDLEKSIAINDEIHDEVKKRIMLSCIFEATQEKLPKKKDPLQPAWVFPRIYGIPDHRKNELLCKNLAMICEQYCNSSSLTLVDDVCFAAPFKAHNKNILFEMTSETVVTTSERIKPIEDASCTFEQYLPDLHPVHCTVGLKPYRFYTMETAYPFSIDSKFPFLQTAFVHLNPSQVKNEFEEEVTETQIHSRSLLKSFTLAAAQARSIYGDDVSELPKPVVMPIIHTDGKMFHFVIYQLNTLEIDKNTKTKNVFWNSPRIPLYEKCEYYKARPILENYNVDVIKRIIAFFKFK